MKKIFAVFIMVLMILQCLLIFTGCSGKKSKGVAATVGNEVITEERVQKRKQYSEIMNGALRDSMGTDEIDDDSTLAEYIMPEDEAEILNVMIRDAVIRQNLGEDTVSYETIESDVADQYLGLKSSATYDDFIRQIKSNIEKQGITEDDYLKLAADYSYDYYNRFTMKKVFSNTLYDKSLEKSFDEQFDEYVENLVNEAEVKQ